MYYIMNVLKNLNLKKNQSQIIVGLMMLVYLYLDTPVPAKLMLNNYLLFLAVFIVGIVGYHLVNHVSIYIAILFIIIAFEVVRKSAEPNLHKIDKKITYYDNMTSTSEKVISDKLKEDDNLEQDMVTLMKIPKVTNSIPRTSPRYQPIAPNLAGSSQL